MSDLSLKCPTLVLLFDGQQHLKFSVRTTRTFILTADKYIDGQRVRKFTSEWFSLNELLLCVVAFTPWIQYSRK